MTISLRINGHSYEVDGPNRNLLSFIRWSAGLTGTKYGCGEGLCGACTVLVDGQPLKSCMSTVGAVAGGSITTIEGLASDAGFHPLQAAFIEESAMQCGYCTPGFIMTACGLLAREAHPSREMIREALSGNLCRCGAYIRIERAILRAAESAP
jgi:aerobic-type carbon monoxide dehydrogenase small subunit (CoxS/CutS family)